MTSLKDTGGDAVAATELIQAGQDGPTLLNGWDTLTFAALAAGVRAVVWGTASIVPEQCVRLHRLLIDDIDLPAARELWARLWPLCSFLECQSYSAAVKAGLRARRRHDRPDPRAAARARRDATYAWRACSSARARARSSGRRDGAPRMRETEWVEPAIELRQLRYFVAVAEELHFGRAAARLHMSQSPLSRAIRELERDLGVVLFLRTTRHVELTPAGQVLLERGRRALTEVELGDRGGAPGGAAGSRRARRSATGRSSRRLARGIAEAVAARRRGRHSRRTLRPSSLRRVASHEIAAAAVFRTPSAASRHGIRVDALRDEPLLAALPETNRVGGGRGDPRRRRSPRSACCCPAGPAAAPSTTGCARWSRRAASSSSGRWRRTSAPWDHRMLPVAAGEAVSVIVGRSGPTLRSRGSSRVPFDPPLLVPDRPGPARGPTGADDARPGGARAARRGRLAGRRD